MLRNVYSALALALALSLLAGCKVPTKGAPSTYTITYDGNGATSGTVPTDGKQYRANEFVTVQGNTGNLARVGWNFRGWADTQAATTVEYYVRSKLKITKSLTLYAVWSGKSYTINFAENGGTGTQTPLRNQTFGTSATLPATTTFRPPPGMRFLGWAETSTGTVIGGAYNPSNYSTAVTLYARWGTNAYTISFNSNGGGGTQASLSAVFGTPVTLPATTTFTPPAGKSFLGWAETSTGTVIWRAYNPSVYNATVTLYAKWVRNPIAGNIDWESIAISGNGQRLAAVVDGGHLYTSTDSGATWTDRSTSVSGIGWHRRWTSIAMSRDGQWLAAVVWHGKLHTSTDSGATWTNRSRTGSAIAGNKKWQSIAMSSDGTKLAALVYGGSHGVSHIYTSKDSGTTWTELTTAGSGRWYSIAISGNGQKLAVGEEEGKLYTSTDSGATWTDRSTYGSTIAGDRVWYSIAMSRDGTTLAAVVYGGGHDSGYIYTSTDSGATWTKRTTAGSGRWYSIAISGNGQKIAAVVKGGHLYTSTDSGATWTDRSTAGGSAIFGNKDWQFIAMSRDGTTLAAVVEGGHIYTSSDGGTTWVDRSE